MRDSDLEKRNGQDLSVLSIFVCGTSLITTLVSAVGGPRNTVHATKWLQTAPQQPFKTERLTLPYNGEFSQVPRLRLHVFVCVCVCLLFTPITSTVFLPRMSYVQRRARLQASGALSCLSRFSARAAPPNTAPRHAHTVGDGSDGVSCNRRLFQFHFSVSPLSHSVTVHTLGGTPATRFFRCRHARDATRQCSRLECPAHASWGSSYNRSAITVYGTPMSMYLLQSVAPFTVVLNPTSTPGGGANHPVRAPFPSSCHLWPRTPPCPSPRLDGACSLHVCPSSR